MRRSLFILTLCSLALGSAWAANAAPQERTLVKGALQIAGGESLSFSIPNGGLLFVQTADRQRFAVRPVVQGDRVDFQLLGRQKQANGKSPLLDQVTAGLGELTWLFAGGDRIDVALHEIVRSQGVETVTAAAEENCPSCSLTCGGIKYTCEVCADGWCCKMECSSGGTCSACDEEPQLQ